MKAAKRLLGFLFPPRCALCGAVVPGGREVCPGCLDALRPAKPAPAGGGLAGCAAPFYYEGPARAGVWRLKFRQKTGGVPFFAREAARAVGEAFPELSFDLIAFVPLSRGELRRRGFNQSKLLAQAISPLLGLPVQELLEKPREGRPQRECSLRERGGNVFGAFTVIPGHSLNGKTVLLCDDVMTTGATLRECAKMLRLAGAAEVCGVVMTRVRSRKERPG